jgi:diphthamide synthase (EF-2-diphthine--ammonia ligase)
VCWKLFWELVLAASTTYASSSLLENLTLSSSWHSSSNLICADEIDSYMYQTVGHHAIDLYADAMGLPLYGEL